ncbi:MULTISPECIES: signal peptide peptidase SppA [unclassified Arenibacter]|uniref:signal peptide peptidase SppA n=1 Tax=unclassified Arenibacter TaxID=2615047 RepID=UPI000E3524B3|nr:MULTISPECIES: signal peptide peptidase SppA [unclassified Arenibacter]MCM4164963.1 signal peptide peptidase SppA [Arenibacter sp. A80]RFT55372.1 signal peptide peptidase SppA [Arenibacter sp. P308M17]
MNFLRNLLAAIVGCLIAFGIMFVMFLILAALIGSGEDTVTIRENSVLEIQLQTPINDYVGMDESNPFAGLFNVNQGLDEILHAIQVAKEDNKIKGISLNNNVLMAGLSQTQAIRDALLDFGESGKFILAFGDFYTQKDYYLASAANEVFLNPVGAMDFKGLSTEVLFLKDLQEKTGVKMEVIRHGKYKSAVEPFLANEMSRDNRTQIKELLDALWQSMLTNISESRDISVEDLNHIADTLGTRTPKYAILSGLIDKELFYDEYESLIKEKIGVDTAEDINYIPLADYIRTANKININGGRDKIAVIYAQGEIWYGEGGSDVIGQGIINDALKKAREDEEVKAIVLRINSPGGSALASDIIWREIEITKQSKPVVVSMGDVAASGGYYIAAGADKIFAEPTTITGSIGVFGTIPNISGLAENIGVNAEQVGTNKNSVEYSLFEPMNDNFRNNVQEGIETTYETFLDRVAKGRGITMAQADSVAQGRVWSGVDAKRLGLVDELGGLDEAIAAAAKMVDLENYGIKKLPKYKSDFEKLMEDMGGATSKSKETIIREEIGAEAYTILKEIRSAMENKGIQARMPFTLNIK